MAVLCSFAALLLALLMRITWPILRRSCSGKTSPASSSSSCRFSSSPAVPFAPSSSSCSFAKKFNVDCLAPYPDAKIKGKTNYRITMDLKSLDRQNWLTVDQNYKEQHQIRKELLLRQPEMMVQCLPEAVHACEEALQQIAEFLCGRYPLMFETQKSTSGLVIKNKATGETFSMGKSGASRLGPLDIASILAMEDLTVLLENGDGEYYIAATASFFPIGWSADQVMGFTVSKMHGPVPHWHEQIGNAVNKFLSRLTPRGPMERASYFVQVTHPGEAKHSILFQPEGVVHKNLDPQPDDLILRKERQTFVKLPRSGAIVFGVKTSLTPLRDVPLDELENLVTEVQSWPDDTAEYKGRDHWGPAVVAFLQAKKAELADMTTPNSAPSSEQSEP